MRRCSHEGCGHQINKGNVSGLCIAHYNERRGYKGPRECLDCGAVIAKHGSTGRCGACYAAFLHPPRLCKHEGCRNRISKTVKSGLCAEHRGHVNKPVMTGKTMEVVREVAAALDVHPRDVLNGDRTAEVVEARAVIASVLRGRGMSYPRIGERLGRDHSSVVNLMQQLPKYAARNPKVAALLERAA